MTRVAIFVSALLGFLSLAAAAGDASLDMTVRHPGGNHDLPPVDPAAADLKAVDPNAPAEPVNRMNAPEISTPVFTSLIVGFVFLIVFIPGFMCLWNIQPPQTFEVPSQNDPRKKMQ